MQFSGSWLSHLVLLSLASLAVSEQVIFRNGIKDTFIPGDLAFSEIWSTLGPFRLDTREASWGADPLEQYGGFRNLSSVSHPSFRSALGEYGLIYWSNTSATLSTSDSRAKIQLLVQFPDIDWSFLRFIYGWAALQHQAWTRGFIRNSAHTELRVELYTDGILEFWLNGEHYWGGDFYTFRRAPVLVTLLPGENQLDIRLIYDIRAMGGNEPPITSVSLEARVVKRTLYVDEKSVMISDILDGKLPSPYGSFICRNAAEHNIELIDIECECLDVHVRPLAEQRIQFALGQSRPIGFLIHSENEYLTTTRFLVTVKYASDKLHTANSITFHVNLRPRHLLDPHKFTYRHPSGSVSYAILRAPSPFARTLRHRPLPVLLNLHGAGVEADSSLVRHMLDDAPDIQAWALFPAGSSPWSADDWHTYGFLDLQAAIHAIPSWIRHMQWKASHVKLDAWFVSGHSNGGQGTWFVLTHRPDQVFAAAPASGYTSIQNYVPYTMWQEADPRMSSLIHSSLASYRHELLVPNFEGVPIFQQHGSADDNVPAYHSRLMSEMNARSFFPSSYAEFPGNGHWWDGVMTTKPLLEFYHSQLHSPAGLGAQLPDTFTIVFPHSFDMGCRAGICVDQLITPDHFGKIRVIKTDNGKNWRADTSNIHRLHLNPVDFSQTGAQVLILDGQEIDLLSGLKNRHWLVRNGTFSWLISSDIMWQSLQERHGRQIGALDTIMRSQTSFLIQAAPSNRDIALQISRNFLQYFGADSKIELSNSNTSMTGTAGNRVVVAEGSSLPCPELDNFPLRFEQRHVVIHQCMVCRDQLRMNLVWQLFSYDHCLTKAWNWSSGVLTS